ncbi:G-type lectin S-receptor-like serine/threonine-protein kinase SD1-1 isoform G [Glycine soja]|nr:G-type lectin S-receptor-like serine/threonine-protein kinase SD1-1 isoform E [Glycine soja]RZC25692.1 G-type lectin S-receptor-like serine/threonine-protein kinase SD1-1 isoform F [Glycine soja]RZC25693.1 G-type lectin S-receptor-like serine/threonine-protein kinase SD1-1 isoform G [Glycine soja]
MWFLATCFLERVGAEVVECASVIGVPDVKIALFHDDGRPVEGKGVWRKLLDRMHETYDSKLSGKDFAYDGERTLFTLGSLARNKLEFTVVLEDVIATRNNGNCRPKGNGELNENDQKKMRHPDKSSYLKLSLAMLQRFH